MLRAVTIETLRRMGLRYLTIRRIAKWLRAFRFFVGLRRRGFEIVFPYDRMARIRLPRIGLASAAMQRHVVDYYDFAQSTSNEPLLRSVVTHLYQSGYLSRLRSIIDIGSWLGDNSLPWASLLEGEGEVIAVDPSPVSTNFITSAAALSGLTNLRPLTAVCAEKVGLSVFPERTGPGARFFETGSGPAVASTTLDELVGPSTPIGLIHIDVEGFEHKVLVGAQKLIENWQPVLIFEQHIGAEPLSKIANMPGLFGYRFFMINEVVPNSQPDCRNFVGVPRKMVSPPDSGWKYFEARNRGFFPATVGNALIAVNENEKT